MSIEETSAPLAVEEAEARPTAGSSGLAVRVRSLLTTRWKGLTLTASLAAAAVFASALYVTSFWPGQQTDAAAEQVVIDSASTATVTLLSYAPDTLDRDLQRAQELMSGEFLTYYGKFSNEVVAPAVRERGIKASAKVLDVAVMEMHPDSAKVLLFLNQETTSRDRPEPALTASSVVVSMTKADGNWLISALDPV
ncbi:hypothetical protein [Mycolicibacterium bacteremicum]|uniref:hypothetical protein n=1 Tax=Mycolicibacterium bacteremicum TaxID=564198 RepID=UPI001F16958C|nr:hypothetical protein [Mycolicibacterium bacteremicum]